MANRSVSRFQAVLNALPDHVRAPIRAETLAQAHGLAEKMRVVVHRGETTMLWRSIRVEPGRRPLRFLVRAGGPLTTTGGPGNQGFAREFMRAVQGHDRPYDYALANEFGTQKMPARPFFWPTYRANKRAIRSAIKRTAVEAIGQLVVLKK